MKLLNCTWCNDFRAVPPNHTDPFGIHCRCGRSFARYLIDELGAWYYGPFARIVAIDNRDYKFACVHKRGMHWTILPDGPDLINLTNWELREDPTQLDLFGNNEHRTGPQQLVWIDYCNTASEIIQKQKETSEKKPPTSKKKKKVSQRKK